MDYDALLTKQAVVLIRLFQLAFKISSLLKYSEVTSLETQFPTLV
jgi:hypothetical protein